MAARKKRPTLYEVYRPRQKSAESASPAQTPAKPPAVPPPASPPAAPTAPLRGVTSRSRSASPVVVSLTMPSLAVVIAVVVVLLFVSFSAGRRYEAFHPGIATAEPDGRQPAQDAAATHSADTTRAADAAPPGGARPAADHGAAAASTAAGREKPAPPAKPKPQPRVVLHRGYDYVVVQHFGKKRKDAVAVARFLRGQGIECALLDGTDIRLVVTEPFLTHQADRAAARAERQRADKLMQRIRQLGRELAKQWAAQGRPGYTLEGCYLHTIK